MTDAIAVPAGAVVMTVADMTARTKVIAVLTCFNRRHLTLACIEALAVSASRAEVYLEAILVDDASTDGTVAAVREHFPWVEVIAGCGDLFWNRAMHWGFGIALQRPADHYLWINDDTHLVPEALSNLLAASRELAVDSDRPAIVVGATAERASGNITYGGRVANSRWRPFNYSLIWDEKRAVPCHVMEGNCVLIPRQVALQVGNLDPVFEHAMGDTDYSLRARRAGFSLFVAPGVAGHCSVNPMGGTYHDASLPLRTRSKLILGRKGLPFRSWMHFTRRHGGFLWPLYFAWPYVKLPLSAARSLLQRQAALQ